MKPDDRSLQQALTRLLEDGTSILGLKLCFRDNTLRSGLPSHWWLHVVPACLRHKQEAGEVCTHYTGVETSRALMGQPEGRIQVCPFGLTELAVPVMVGGFFSGPLFAGPCWTEQGPPPDPGLVIAPSVKWLEERLTLLRAIATEIGRLMEGEGRAKEQPQKRRAIILNYVREQLGEAVSIHELAEILNLSPSRTTHLVQELFHTSLPLLAREARLQAAAQELTLTDLPIGRISRRHGFGDQNYFSRIFRLAFGMSPRLYRQRYPRES